MIEPIELSAMLALASPCPALPSSALLLSPVLTQTVLPVEARETQGVAWRGVSARSFSSHRRHWHSTGRLYEANASCQRALLALSFSFSVVFARHSSVLIGLPSNMCESTPLYQQLRLSKGRGEGGGSGAQPGYRFAWLSTAHQNLTMPRWFALAGRGHHTGLGPEGPEGHFPSVTSQLSDDSDSRYAAWNGCC